MSPENPPNFVRAAGPLCLPSRTGTRIHAGAKRVIVSSVATRSSASAPMDDPSNIDHKPYVRYLF